jgi:hypothetical protein
MQTGAEERASEGRPHPIAQLFPRVRKERERHQAAVHALQRELREAQRACPHEHTTYHPAEGSDSYTGCDDCGAQQDRRGEWSPCVDCIRW